MDMTFLYGLLALAVTKFRRAIGGCPSGDRSPQRRRARPVGQFRHGGS